MIIIICVIAITSNFTNTIHLVLRTYVNPSAATVATKISSFNCDTINLIKHLVFSDKVHSPDIMFNYSAICAKTSVIRSYI